jgi:hypothetical protein
LVLAAEFIYYDSGQPVQSFCSSLALMTSLPLTPFGVVLAPLVWFTLSMFSVIKCHADGAGDQNAILRISAIRMRATTSTLKAAIPVLEMQRAPWKPPRSACAPFI